MLVYDQAFTRYFNNQEETVESTDRLPRVEARFNVIVPSGGYRRQFRSFDIRESTYIDLQIENSDGIVLWLRVIPANHDAVVLDPEHPAIYLIQQAQGVFLSEDGLVALGDRPIVDVWASVNMEVQVAGESAGKLKIWNYTPPTPSIGE